MFELIKISLDDFRSLELLIEYRGDNFRNEFLYRCLRANYKDPSLYKIDHLSDIDAITYIVNKEKNMGMPNEQYLLLHDDVPVCHSVIRYVNELTGDIEITTLESERGKGYAKECLKRLEDNLFIEEGIIFTTIKDLTTTGASTKLALANGYVLGINGYYVKMNPYISLEEAKKRAKSHRNAM